MSVTRPVNLQIPFANSGSKNTIPVPSQIGVTAGAASFTDGFPPLTFTPLASGGVQPSGADFNGILNILSQHIAFVNAGGRYRFDATLATAIGGYPVGFVLQDDAGLNSYVNISAGNTTNFNSSPSSIGVSWIPYAGQAATQAGMNIYAIGGGTANAQTATYSPAITALTDGMVLWFKAAAANTGATTLNVNGLGASPVVGAAHSALQGGEIVANGRCMVIWSATLTSWVLIECTGGALQVAPSTQSNQVVNQSQVLGVGQTMQSLLGSRSPGTTYTNSTGKPITLYLYGNTTAANGYLATSVSGIGGPTTTQPISSAGIGVSVMVPSGATYLVTISSVTLVNWYELR